MSQQIVIAARKIASEFGVEIVNQSVANKYDYHLVKDGQTIKTGLKDFVEVFIALEYLQEQWLESQLETVLEAIVIEETAPDTVGLSLEEIEPSAEIEATVIVPTIVTDHQKPQFQVQLDVKKTTSQQLKEQVLALLNLQTASQAAKWAKQQGMEVDLCYKSHWAAVLEKAQDLLAVAA